MPWKIAFVSLTPRNISNKLQIGIGYSAQRDLGKIKFEIIFNSEDFLF